MTSLRKRMIEDMQVRNRSPHTQAAYIQQASLFSCGYEPLLRELVRIFDDFGLIRIEVGTRSSFHARSLSQPILDNAQQCLPALAALPLDKLTAELRGRPVGYPTHRVHI
jgi:hypothetical protein